MEQEVNAFRSLANTDLNVELLREVLRSDQLVKDLSNESSTIKHLVNHVTEALDAAHGAWSQNPDPTSTEALNAHRDARAARLLIDWIQTTIHAGAMAEETLSEEAMTND